GSILGASGPGRPYWSGGPAPNLRGRWCCGVFLLPGPCRGGAPDRRGVVGVPRPGGHPLAGHVPSLAIRPDLHDARLPRVLGPRGAEAAVLREAELGGLSRHRGEAVVSSL